MSRLEIGRNETDISGEFVTAGGKVTRTYEKSKGCTTFFTQNTPGVTTTRKYITDDNQIGAAVTTFSNIKRTQSEPSNIVSAFINSIKMYHSNSVNIKSFGADSSDNQSLFYYSLTASSFRWQSSTSKNLVSKLEFVLGLNISLDEKAKALCSELLKNLGVMGSGLYGIFAIHELVDPLFHRNIDKDRKLSYFASQFIISPELAPHN